jgi:GNAT superfamily N-acetyltransferase
MALINIAAYGPDPVDKYRNPNAHQYPHDRKMAVIKNITISYLNPRVLTLVACSTKFPDVAFAYGMYTRIGDDSGAQKFLSERSWAERAGRGMLSYIATGLFKAYNWIWPNRASSKPHNAIFEHSIKQDKERYWSPISFPRRQNRWHVNTIVVLPEYQGKGLGRLLMGHILDRAEREGVPLGLSASPEGERLYRKLGFSWLGDFYMRVGGGDHESGGGHMIWWPQGIEKDGDY